MRLIGEILLIIINVGMAGHHAYLISEGKKIQHGWWGLLYFAAAAAFAYLSHSWELLVCSLFVRKVFFDLSLNLFRGKPLFYVSSSTTSIIDKFHNKIFGNKSEIYMALYLAVCLGFAVYFLK